MDREFLPCSDLPDILAEEKRKANRIIDKIIIAHALDCPCECTKEEILFAKTILKITTPPLEYME